MALEDMDSHFGEMPGQSWRVPLVDALGNLDWSSLTNALLLARHDAYLLRSMLLHLSKDMFDRIVLVHRSFTWQ